MSRLAESRGAERAGLLTHRRRLPKCATSRSGSPERIARRSIVLKGIIRASKSVGRSWLVFRKLARRPALRHARPANIGSVRVFVSCVDDELYRRIQVRDGVLDLLVGILIEALDLVKGTLWVS